MQNRIRRLLVGLTLTATTIAGTALTTGTAHADTTTTTVTDSTLLPEPVTDLIGVVVGPLDTWWG